MPGVADANQRRPFFQQFGWTQGIDLYCNCANSRYNSLQIRGERRNTWGLTLSGNYTYGVAKGDSGDSFTFLFNRRLGYGDKDFLSRHQGVVSFLYDLPFGRGRKFGATLSPEVDHLLGGWTLNGISSIYSGIPFTPSFDAPLGVVRPNAGPGNRPDRGAVSPFEGARGNRDQFFVGGLGSAFLIPSDNSFGNFGINTLHGPKFYQQDLTLAKSVKFRERYDINFRVEAFNVWNHANLGLPVSNVTASDAGRINGLAANSQMRRLQFGIRFGF